MILNLYLGGQLQPLVQYRHSNVREYMIYASMLRSCNIKTQETSIDILKDSLANAENQTQVDSIIASMNKSLNNIRYLKTNNSPALSRALEKETLIKQQGLTGVPELDSMIQLYKIMDESNLVHMKEDI